MHFNWYYQQARLVYEHCTRNDNILEIGIGTSLLADLLRRRNWKVKTLDIDEDKNPDFCESASEVDYSTENIDIALAFEVFEHMPFTTFEKVIERLGESKVGGVYFSLSWNEYRLIDFKLSLPSIHEIHFRIPISSGKISTSTHFWELANREKNIDEKRLITVENVVGLFKKNGFDVALLRKVGRIQYFQAVLSH